MKRNVGRPALVPGQRSKRIWVTLPLQVVADLRHRATLEGMKLPAFMRRVLTASVLSRRGED
jgi:hypothetical protein